MSMNFPISPSVNDLYTYESRTWKWNGSVWNLQYTTSTFDELTPSQTGNRGKYLTTNGTTTSWSTVEAGFNPFLLAGM